MTSSAILPSTAETRGTVQDILAEPSAAADRGRDIGFWEFIAPSAAPAAENVVVHFAAMSFPYQDPLLAINEQFCQLEDAVQRLGNVPGVRAATCLARSLP